ncbi:MAG: hypothetical protein B6I26_06975 [Desulfobacteraceae bacterium 4572_130]|nr:MAG: hypothetical protein B6I26_06975 [Desulfobacteraceae bacterium 4572_130]
MTKIKNKYYTVELAKLYEKQGYFKQAITCYSAVFKKDKKNKTLFNNIKRLEILIKKNEKSCMERKLKKLFKEWIELLFLEKRTKNLKNNSSQISCQPSQYSQHGRPKKF